MRDNILPLVVVCTAALLGKVRGNPARAPLIDPSKARELFRLGSNPGSLTLTEIEVIFRAFDADGDNLMERTEFVQEWLRMGLGSALSAGVLFDHADTNNDGILSSNPDFSRIYTFFDINRDGLISEPEFVVAWATLSG